jgi:hypothetical protein
VARDLYREQIAESFGIGSADIFLCCGGSVVFGVRGAHSGTGEGG